jgi:acyl-CoA thioester hydrolase
VTPLFTHHLEVRFRDCDALGHVNNAVYLTYLEETRFAFWRASGLGRQAPDPAPPDGDPAAAALGVIVARIEIDYRRPAKHGDKLRIHIGVTAIGRTSFTCEYEIVDAADTLIANARSVIVRYDYAAGRPVALSEEIKQALTRTLY